MDLTLSPQQLDVATAFESFFTKECPPARVRAAEPGGFDAALWRALVSIGGPGVAVAAPLGGGGSLLDAVLVAEQYGRRVAPVPLIEASVAARALWRARHATPAVARGGQASKPALVHSQNEQGAESVLQAVLAGERLVTVAPHPVIDGVARLVPAGSYADGVIGLARDALVLIELHRGADRRSGSDLGAMSLADVVLAEADVTVLAEGPEAVRLASSMDLDWRLLRAAALVGASAEALSIGVRYASSREQFGRPIGAYQAVAHALADCATEIDGARLLVYEAAWAAGEGERNAAALASMAAAFAARTAERATAVALHVHGGYGFMQEYDPQLYYRRVRAWTLLHGSLRDQVLHLADELWPRQAFRGAARGADEGALLAAPVASDRQHGKED